MYVVREPAVTSAKRRATSKVRAECFSVGCLKLGEVQVVFSGYSEK